MKLSNDTRHRDTLRERWVQRLRRAHRWFDRHPLLRLTRKIVVGTLGVLLVIGGMVTGPFLPGPQVLVVLLGLALLASEFVWARLAIRKGEATAHRASRRFSGRRLKWYWRWKKRLRQRWRGHGLTDPGV
ncbi:MAG: PGPGW domain-containing protein [Phycisphaeraceae bacterium]